MSKTRVIVVGAGVFGGWTALWLQRRGCDVTLLDTWGAGHARASSGGETRVIRCSYQDPFYARLAKRALQLWQEEEPRLGMRAFHKTGVMFLGQAAGQPFIEAVEANFQKEGIDHEIWDTEEISRRYPQMSTHDIQSAVFEPEAGYLLARRACAAVAERFRAEGGHYQKAHVLPGPIRNGRMQHIELDDGSVLTGDHIVFACGPWLPSLFAEHLSATLTVTRQEVVYFGTPSGNDRYDEANMPPWADFGEQVIYGIPGNEERGFKIAEDVRGPAFDPERDDRCVQDESIDRLRQYLAMRFPGLANAPVVESRVCQYTSTGDDNFLIDIHPQAENVLFAGGGSGHGFKHGPAIGEYIASTLVEGKAPDQRFSLARFEND